MTLDPTTRLRMEADAARALLDSLRASGDDGDEDIVASAIEGETNLVEAVAAALELMDDAEAHVIGLKAKEAAFADRRAMFEHRIERLRASIERALMTVELAKPLVLDTATISLSKRARALVVTSEAEIPSAFFKQPPPPAPKLDKKALVEALKAGAEVPGAELDNGGFSLTVRRK